MAQSMAMRSQNGAVDATTGIARSPGRHEGAEWRSLHRQLQRPLQLSSFPP